MSRFLAVILVSACCAYSVAQAQAPSGSTGECKDGTYSSAASKRGACAGHGGVKEWYANEKKESVTTKPKVETAAPAATKAATTTKSTTSAMPTTAAAGGGEGKVWVNTASNVYHCQSDRWYGKTKKGEYMTEAEAKSHGMRPAAGKTCVEKAQ